MEVETEMMRREADPPSTQPGYSPSPGGGSVLALHLVYPRELIGLQLPLSYGNKLGRTTACAIPHSTVSREHAVVLEHAEGWLLKDLNSRNGTRVDGVRESEPRLIPPQSVVRMGDVLGVVDEARRADDKPSDPRLLHALPGVAPSMLRLRRQLALAGPDPASVLVLGETGTGKERLAHALHEHGGRPGPLVAINCAGIPAQLFESELFGHERGAFTGATVATPGLFRAAEGGTLFMDEVGELSLDLQAKLLRALQEGEIRPVGGTHTVRVDVRVVAATNRDLRERVELGEFRRDLHARLSWWELCLPPLRQRRIDIPAWLMLLYDQWQAERGAGPPLVLAPDAAERVLIHDWLDNLRGLERLVHRVASAGLHEPVGLAELEELLPELRDRPARTPAPAAQEPRDAKGTPNQSSTPPRRRRNCIAWESDTPKAPSEPVAPQKADRTPHQKAPERAELLRVYQAMRGNVRAVAKHFGRDRRQIYRWLERMNISRNIEENGGS